MFSIVEFFCRAFDSELLIHFYPESQSMTLIIDDGVSAIAPGTNRGEHLP